MVHHDLHGRDRRRPGGRTHQPGYADVPRNPLRRSSRRSPPLEAACRSAPLDRAARCDAEDARLSPGVRGLRARHVRGLSDVECLGADPGCLYEPAGSGLDSRRRGLPRRRRRPLQRRRSAGGTGRRHRGQAINYRLGSLGFLSHRALACEEGRRASPSFGRSISARRYSGSSATSPRSAAILLESRSRASRRGRGASAPSSPRRAAAGCSHAPSWRAVPAPMRSAFSRRRLSSKATRTRDGKLGSLRKQSVDKEFVSTTARSAELGIDVFATKAADHFSWPPRQFPRSPLRCRDLRFRLRYELHLEGAHDKLDRLRDRFRKAFHVDALHDPAPMLGGCPRLKHNRFPECGVPLGRGQNAPRSPRRPHLVAGPPRLDGGVATPQWRCPDSPWRRASCPVTRPA
jgi:hypothetical protein